MKARKDKPLTSENGGVNGMLRDLGLRVRYPGRTFATVDHIVPTDRLVEPFDDPLADANNVVPEFMLIQHAEKLAWGALARILAIPRQPFSDGAAAEVYRARFTEACANLQSATIRGQQRAPMRTKPMWM